MKKLSDKIARIDSLLRDYYGEPPRKETPQKPLNVLIGTILSQNTNDKNSWRAYKNLRDRYKTWEEVRLAPTEEVMEVIKSAGLAKQKSAAIKGVLDELYAKQGRLDLEHTRTMSDEDIMKELTSYKGVGVKTAACVLLFSLKRNICPVDTHVNRTVQRIGLTKTGQPDKTFYALMGNIPEGLAHSFHSNLILLGREFCRPTAPDCPHCPLLDVCAYKEKNMHAGPKKFPYAGFLLLDKI
ncbi:MAG: endonuclease III [Ignavibacteriales bacterium]|nr:MAG: endonuclease III [Ignavibacteriaceae bacterium]MBW7872638.1 endonuclease III [Ignavibacteria bacterium]MCZ2141808.1 endonuclease III [Ignavibacteriales bacterium]OQY75613.1 MAG: hypothetical protein B6D45_05485 [Ignavibacteriales bacterium UTCHB3]MBV6444977.1 Ultraviolet N-glycosylase/AP lyase [Ignavibacteriaceae bacterium]